MFRQYRMSIGYFFNTIVYSHAATLQTRVPFLSIGRPKCLFRSVLQLTMIHAICARTENKTPNTHNTEVATYASIIQNKTHDNIGNIFK